MSKIFSERLNKLLESVAEKQRVEQERANAFERKIIEMDLLIDEVCGLIHKEIRAIFSEAGVEITLTGPEVYTKANHTYGSPPSREWKLVIPTWVDGHLQACYENDSNLQDSKRVWLYGTAGGGLRLLCVKKENVWSCDLFDETKNTFIATCSLKEGLENFLFYLTDHMARKTIERIGWSKKL